MFDGIIYGPVRKPRGGGGRSNNIPSLRVPAARIFKELPCFGVKFLNIHTASEFDFLSGILSGESIVMQISFLILIFLLFSNQFFWGRGKLLEGKDSNQRNNLSKHRNELFSKETLTNSCTVCHLITINMLKTSKVGLISWLKKKQISQNQWDGAEQYCE